MISDQSKISNLHNKTLNRRFKLFNSCLLTAVFCLLTVSSFARFDFSPNCQKAMQEILDLRMETAREILSTENNQHPDNIYVPYLEHFADIVEIIVTDDEGLYEKMMETYPERFENMDRFGEESPYNSILQSEMLFYTGLAQLKFGSQINGTAKIYNAYRQVKEHRRENPDLHINLKMAGIFNIVMDFIPKSLRWLTGMLGVSGDSEKGMAQLKEYFQQVKSTPGLAQEAVIIINLAYKMTWQDEEGLAFMSELDDKLTDNVLARYVWAISATYCFDNELAIAKLDEIDPDRLQVPLFTLDYVLGRCRINRLDKNANQPLERYLREYSGYDFKKDACIRLSFYYLLEGKIDLYEEYVKMASTIGQQLRERDQEAMKESESNVIPHTGLLKARLLFDGGYFLKADSVMHDIPLYSLNLLPYKLEYSYRRGRIDQMLGRTDDALAELEKAVWAGAGQPYTFATRAALQIATIYEEQKNYPNALHWYKECLKYYDETHTVGSVEDKAEKGRKRMEREL